MKEKDVGCCRAPVGGDMKFFEELGSVLSVLESRGSDRVLMDLSVSTKKVLYERLLAQAERISSLMGDQ